MSELIDAIQQICQRTITATTPVDLVIGTVTGISPLTVTINASMPPLPAEVLYLTEAVIEKKIDLNHTHDFSHTHTDTGGDTTNGQSTTITDPGTLYSKPFTNAPYFPDYGTHDGSRIVTPGLAKSDKVLMLRVMSGQAFILISRVVPA